MKSLIVLAALCAATAALAHSWYPPACCNGVDCKPVACDLLVEAEGGSWLYMPTGTLFSPSKVHPSQDKNCHVCMSNKNALCAFILNGV